MVSSGIRDNFKVPILNYEKLVKITLLDLVNN